MKLSVHKGISVTRVSENERVIIYNYLNWSFNLKLSLANVNLFI